jgi:hypothetical protein
MRYGETKGRLEAVLRREVVDKSGALWRVTESVVHDVPGAEAPHCLIFDSAAICRRLWDYPADWARLPDDEVLTLKDHPRSHRDRDD